MTRSTILAIMARRAVALSLFYAACTLLPTQNAAGQIAAGQTLYGKLQTAAVEVIVQRRLAGSGCFADAAGHIFTAAHVVGDPGQAIEVRTETQGQLAAEVVAIDYGHDLALLRATGGKEPFAYLALAEKQGVAGETVFLYGAPIFRHGVLLRGVLGRDATTYEYCGGRMIEAMHISGPSPPGTSGGPWVNMKSELVGVQSSLINTGQAPVGIAIVAPLASLKLLLETKRSASTATLGTAVEEVWGQELSFLEKLAPETQGVIVRQLKGDGPAGKAGIKEWEIITHVDGHQQSRSDDFIRFMRAQLPGHEFRLRVCDRTGQNPREVALRSEILEAKWQEALETTAAAP